MAKAHETWTVLPHGPLEELAENLWRVQGSIPKAPFDRVMAVARTAAGKLVIHGAIALEEPAMQKLESLGDVGFILVPNGFHRLDAKIWKQRYPTARVLGPRGARAKIEEVIQLEGTYSDFPGDDTVKLEMLEGVGDTEGVLIVRSKDGTSLVFNDAVFNLPHQPGIGGVVLRLIGSSGGPKVSKIFRTLGVKNKPAFKANLERLAQIPDIKRILVAHQDTITSDPARVLREVAATL